VKLKNNGPFPDSKRSKSRFSLRLNALNEKKTVEKIFFSKDAIEELNISKTPLINESISKENADWSPKVSNDYIPEFQSPIKLNNNIS
jgi:hypothetical protein